MGIFTLSSGGDPNPPSGNPRADNFTIVTVEEYQRGTDVLCVAEIHYPDARNYEGKKILLYQATEKQLRAATILDPHFSERNIAHMLGTPTPTVPIARFEPTDAGWYLARTLVKSVLRDANDY